MSNPNLPSTEPLDQTAPEVLIPEGVQEYMGGLIVSSPEETRQIGPIRKFVVKVAQAMTAAEKSKNGPINY